MLDNLYIRDYNSYWDTTCRSPQPSRLSPKAQRQAGGAPVPRPTPPPAWSLGQRRGRKGVAGSSAPMRPIFGFSSCAARSRSSPMRSLRCSELHPNLGHLDRRISRRRFPAAPLARDQRRQALGEPWNRDALLLRGVALADRHRAIVQRLEVDSDAEGRADLILAAITPPDVAAGLVVLDAELTLQG